MKTKLINSTEDLTVKLVTENSKDKIEQPKLSEENVIPKLLTSSIICGRSGSGKSVLISFLLNAEQCFKNVFDMVCLVSPTATSDDVQKSFPVTDEVCICDDLEKAPEFIQTLMDKQKELIKENGASDSPLLCLILDDVAGSTKFLNTKQFTKCFTQSRHYNMTVFVLTQQYKNIPKRARMQANNIFFFKSPETESHSIVEDHTPPGYSKRKMLELINYATHEPYSFLYINYKAPIDDRYRKNLNEIIIL